MVIRALNNLITWFALNPPVLRPLLVYWCALTWHSEHSVIKFSAESLPDWLRSLS